MSNKAPAPKAPQSPTGFVRFIESFKKINGVNSALTICLLCASYCFWSYGQMTYEHTKAYQYDSDAWESSADYFDALLTEAINYASDLHDYRNRVELGEDRESLKQNLFKDLFATHQAKEIRKKLEKLKEDIKDKADRKG